MLRDLLGNVKENGRAAREFEDYARTPEGIKEIIKYIIEHRTGGCPAIYYPKQRTEAVEAIQNAIKELRKEMNFE